MPFPPPPLPPCLPPLLHSESLVIYLFGIVLGQSIQFPLMKYPSHFLSEIFGSVTSLSISVVSALLLKT